MAVEFIDATLRPKKSLEHLLKICYGALLVLLAFASFPLIIRSSFFSTISHTQQQSIHAMPQHIDDQVNHDDQLLNTLFRDLTNEGLMKKTTTTTTNQNTIFMSNKGEYEVVTNYNMDHVLFNDIEKQKSIMDNKLDFIFTTNFPSTSKFIDRTLKIDGVVVVVLSDNPSQAFYKPSNYKIAYMRRFDLIAVAMKKTKEASMHNDETTKNNWAPRKLCGYSSEAKKDALKNLEDVLLEPPRASSGKSRVYLKRTRFLPDLMGDSLEGYPRRVFIDVGLQEKDRESGSDWFPKNYPTRNMKFEMYKIESVSEDSSSKGNSNDVPQIGMSDWLRKNVKDEEYVVMKAEAEVVEEIMRSDSIGLVDELFLECKTLGKKGSNGNRRAYWECLALYGKLRDEGVAVHQWWS